MKSTTTMPHATSYTAPKCRSLDVQYTETESKSKRRLRIRTGPGTGRRGMREDNEEPGEDKQRPRKGEEKRRGK